MDQLRTILAWLKRQHFWVLSVLVALIAIGCWWSASRTLRSELTKNMQDIDREFTEQASTRNKPFLPNQVVIDKQKEEIKNQAKAVEATWKKLYERQREHVLEWPDDLSPQFREKVEKLKFGAEMDRDMLNDYQNYARGYFPQLPAIVDAPLIETPTSGGYGEGAGGRGTYGDRGGYGGGYGERGMDAGMLDEPQEDFTCEWLNQGEVREKLIFPTRPSSIRVWVTQEDLWVYKTLLNVIRRTNEAAGATRQSNAAVRVIYALEVGQNAAMTNRASGRVYMPASAAPAGDVLSGEMPSGTEDPGGDRGAYSPYGGTGDAGAAGMDRGRMGEGYGGTGAPSPEQEKSFLLSYRYLDAEGKPVAFGGGGGDPSMALDPTVSEPTATPDTPIDTTAFGVEYKRLPVRMTLQMDQRWLTHLISECANQPLQVEVQEVRINPSDMGTSSGGEGFGRSGYGGGGYGGGGYGGGGGREGGYGGGGAGSPFPDRTGVQTFNAQPNIVNVVIQGIIYIFNEPNPEVLKTSEEADAGQMAAAN